MEWKRFDEDRPKVGRRFITTDEDGDVFGPYWAGERYSGDYWTYYTPPKRKVTKTVEAWAVNGDLGLCCMTEYERVANEHIRIFGGTKVHLTGTYEVEEECDG